MRIKGFVSAEVVKTAGKDKFSFSYLFLDSVIFVSRAVKSNIFVVSPSHQPKLAVVALSFPSPSTGRDPLVRMLTSGVSP